ncbi:MAG: hypothetical protein H7126_14740 [Candidatus Parcubacteria bacterium]|nr:hypothetical protein [Leptolyngbyaceae cyanobacterium LF-bin-113]
MRQIGWSWRGRLGDVPVERLYGGVHRLVWCEILVEKWTIGWNCTIVGWLA